MNSITINFKDNTVYKNVLWFLSKFSPNELEVLDRGQEFEQTLKLVHADYDALENGKTELHSLETVNNQMEDIINSYEG